MKSVNLLFIVFAFLLASCASSSVLIGTARAPISPDQVKVYLQPPANYETIAMLGATDAGASPFSEQSRMNKVIGRLKASAAKVGANGVLFQGVNTTVLGPLSQMNKGQAIAIYVPDN